MLMLNQNVKKAGTGLFALIFILFFSTNLYAVTSPIGIGAFSGSETVIDFNSLADLEEITTQYAGTGATFSGGIYGYTNSGDLIHFPDNGGGVIACNWYGSHELSFTVNFDSTQTRVGFYVETWDDDNTTIEVRLDGNLQGSEQFDTGPGDDLTVIFIGVEEPEGFDSMTVTVQNNNNGFLAIDDLRFEGSSVTPASIPTLSEWGMIVFMLLLSGVSFYYMKRSNSVA